MIAGVFERGTDGPRAIVAAVDGSTTSLRAASYAAGLARRQSAELVGIFVSSMASMGGFVPEAALALSVRLVRAGRWPVTVVP